MLFQYVKRIVWLKKEEKKISMQGGKTLFDMCISEKHTNWGFYKPG